jgi:methoxymalonate biosynthesis acyl carrier protein
MTNRIDREQGPPPPDERERILEFFRNKGRAAGLGYDTDLFRGGYINSLFALEMVVHLEKTFGIRIANAEITEENFRTISSIAGVVNRARGEHRG